MVDQQYPDPGTGLPALSGHQCPGSHWRRVCLIPVDRMRWSGVDDRQSGSGMLLEKLLHLVYQPIVELLGHHSEVPAWMDASSVEIKESALKCAGSCPPDRDRALHMDEWRSSRAVSPELPGGTATAASQDSCRSSVLPPADADPAGQQILHKKVNSEVVVNRPQGMGINGT